MASPSGLSMGLGRSSRQRIRPMHGLMGIGQFMVITVLIYMQDY